MRNGTLTYSFSCGGAGTGITGPQEDSNEGKLCLSLKMGGQGGVRVKKRWRVEGVG
jgi:hypothetical protein